MNRIEQKFNTLKETGSKALITFITAGDPDIDTTIELVLSMEGAGADIIELGIPYSDPLADGPVIQAASIRALRSGIKIKDIMEAVKTIRESSSVPLIYLVYYNSIFKYGVEEFIKDACSCGIDGLIVPDLPVEERLEMAAITDKYDICLIPLVAPTSKNRIGKITANGRGFVYCVSSIGVTGVRQDIDTNIAEYMDSVSQYTKMPKAIGFGISGPEMAQRFKPYCDGIIVGSAIVRKIAEAGTREQAVLDVKKFVEEIKAVL